MHNNPHLYNPMAYAPEGMMPTNPGFAMGYVDPQMQMQGYMDPRDPMARDRNQGYPMKKSYPRSQNYGDYPPKSHQTRGKPFQHRGGSRNEHYQKYGERNFRQSYAYGEEGVDDDYSQGKLLPGSKKISKYPRDQNRRYEGGRPSYYEDQRYHDQGYHESSRPDRRHNMEDPKSLSPSMFFKTKMCPHLQDGICGRGQSCNYAHNQNELRSAPNLKKTRLCQQFLSGKCTRGNFCSFAHGEEELRATPEFFKTSLCNSYLKGNCRAGEHCRYAHGHEELRQTKADEGYGVQQQQYDMSMYRSQQYNMSEYDLSSYQMMEPNPMDMNMGGSMVNPLNQPMPMDPNYTSNFENKKPETVGYETDPTQKSEVVPQSSQNAQNTQNTYVNNNFNDYVHNDRDRKTSANKTDSPQVENSDNIAFNTFNPEKINSLLSSNQNQNGNF